MSTYTHTYTKTDILKVLEKFHADLHMLAVRTQAMEKKDVSMNAHDVLLMAEWGCLQSVHIQLRDFNNNLVKAHKYSVKKGIFLDSQRPGANKWPCLPDGKLHIIVTYSNSQTAEKLKQSGQLKIKWSRSNLSTDYSEMQAESNRAYSSNGYGLQRETFINY